MQSIRMAGLVACLVLAGCGADPREGAGIRGASENAAAVPPAATPVVAPGPALDTLAPEVLRERAVAAMAAQRLYAPAGDNAMEAYLALRDRVPGDGAVSMALAELQPYALIAAEQALARRETDEAARLLALMERVDADAPALPRLRVALEDTRRAVQAAAALAAREQARVDAEAGALAARAAPVAAPATPAPTQSRPAVAAGPVQAPAPQRAPVPQPVAPPPADTAAPAAVAAVAPSAGEATARRAPRLTRDAAPQYPRNALARGIEGEVDLAFAVEPDGSVSDVRVLGARPSSIFNDAARSAALRWRFEATGERHATSRTLRFRLPRNSS